MVDVGNLDHHLSGDCDSDTAGHTKDLPGHLKESEVMVRSCHEFQADKRGKAVVAQSGLRPEASCPSGT